MNVNKAYNDIEFKNKLIEWKKDFLKHLKEKKVDVKDISVTFEGNYLGDVNIATKEIIKEKIKNDKKEIETEKITLRDHNDKIKYIDYNKRLNMFLTYSLDGFINIYTFPKCKLVRAIDISVFKIIELKKVILVSNPFPMIFTYDSEKLYSLTINGDLIKSIELKDLIIEKSKQYQKFKYKIIPCIDKDFGISNDFIYINIKAKENIGVENQKYQDLDKIKVTFPSFKSIKIGKEKEAGYCQIKIG